MNATDPRPPLAPSAPTAETATAPAPSERPAESPSPPELPARPGHWFFRRRRMVVHAPTQVRGGIVLAGVALVLVALLDLSLWSSWTQATDAIVAELPQMESFLRARDRVDLALVLIASAVFLGGVFLVGVLDAHRTAGAAYNLRLRLGEVEHGRYSTRLRLRRGDNLRELEAPFNAMCRTLEARRRREIEVLERLAAQAREVGSPPEAEELGRKLRALADELRGAT